MHTKTVSVDSGRYDYQFKQWAWKAQHTDVGSVICERGKCNMQTWKVQHGDVESATCRRGKCNMQTWKVQHADVETVTHRRGKCNTETCKAQRYADRRERGDCGRWADQT